MTHHAITHDHHPTLRHPDREAVGAELQGALVTLLDLALLGKQAHWNLVGPHFRSLHEFLDEMVDAWRLASDAVAERAVALGHAPDGMARTIASRSPLSALPEGQILDQDAIAAFTRLLTDATGDIRTRMDRVEDVDPVTADILHGVVERLEEQLWMVRVQAG